MAPVRLMYKLNQIFTMNLIWPIFYLDYRNLAGKLRQSIKKRIRDKLCLYSKDYDSWPVTQSSKPNLTPKRALQYGLGIKDACYISLTWHTSAYVPFDLHLGWQVGRLFDSDWSWRDQNEPANGFPVSMSFLSVFLHTESKDYRFRKNTDTYFFRR